MPSNIAAMLTVERLDFSKEKIFANFRDGLPKSDGKTKNLMDCKDDVIFIWDNKNKKLLTQNVKVLDKDPPVYQVRLEAWNHLLFIYHFYIAHVSKHSRFLQLSLLNMGSFLIQSN